MENQWTFVSMFVDQTIDNQYAMRYYLDLPNHSNNVIFQSRNNGPCYQLGPLTISTWGGKDPYHDPSGCYIQYLRMYWDWVADSEEKMQNLALMELDGMLLHFGLFSLFGIGILYLFYFASNQLISNNQTFKVDSMTNAGEKSIIGFKGN